MNDRIPDNEMEWRSRENHGVSVGYISSNGVKYGQYSEPIYISIQDEDYDNVGIALTTEQAREFAAHLIVLADDYDALKPKEPTRAERWAAAPLGTLITPEGKAYVNDVGYRVKVGVDTWVTPLDERYAQNSEDLHVSHERDFHSDWDIAGTKN